MDRVRPLADTHVSGRLEASLEASLRADTELARLVARSLVLSNFPDTVAPDVLAAVGLDPDSGGAAETIVRRRDPRWRREVLLAWDRQCAFCGYDGQVADVSAGIDAAHVRWFSFGGPDDLDNGLALCVLHHKLFDLGAMGLDPAMRVQVSASFTARTAAGRTVYDLHGRELRPRPGTALPAPAHVTWHSHEVFKGQPLTA